MDFQGKYLIPAPPNAVWAALHDPDILASCIPGSQSVTRTSNTEYEALAVIKIGPVKAKFKGKVTWQDKVAPDGFTHAGILSGEGKGGPAGFAKGQSEVQLAVDGETTILTYVAKATVGGKLAQIGQRLIDSTAKSLADNFFASFEELMRDSKKPIEGVTSAITPKKPQPKKTNVKKGLKPQIWVIGLIAAVILLLLLFGVRL
jgi:hypothetical protein